MQAAWDCQLRRNTTIADDVLSVSEAVTYTTILYKVFALFSHSVTHGFLFTLKVDDDTYVNVPEVVQTLRAQCVSEGCTRERLYMGHVMTGAAVFDKVRAAELYYFMICVCIAVFTFPVFNVPERVVVVQTLGAQCVSEGCMREWLCMGHLMTGAAVFDKVRDSLCLLCGEK